MPARPHLTIPLLALLSALSTIATASQPVTVVVRRTLLDKNAVEKPAQLQITSPDEGSSSYSVDIGLSLVFASFLTDNSQWDFSFTGEYHRNTLTDKDQDSRLASFSALGLVGDLTTCSWSFLPQFAVRYKDDRVKESESLLLSADLSAASKLLSMGEIIGPANAGLLWQPRIGAEYEDILDAAEGNLSGSVGRVYGTLDLALYPARKKLSERLLVYYFFQYWSDFSESREIDDGRDDHYLRRAGVTYYVDPKNHFGIGWERVSGENPTEGLPNQRYDQLTLKVKF